MGVLNDMYIGFELFNKIENKIKEKSVSYKKEIVNELVSFLISDKFFACYGSFKEEYLSLLIRVCEINEKLLFLKILFPLLEELKKNKFENQLEKLEKLKKEDFVKLNNIYYGGEFQKMMKKNAEKVQKFFEDLNSIDQDYITNYKNFTKSVMNMVFGIKEFLGKEDSFRKEYFVNRSSFEFKNFLKIITNEKSMIINEINQMESFSYIEEFYQFIVSAFYSFINNDKINNLFKVTYNTLKNKNVMEEFCNPKLKENYHWFLFEEYSNKNNPNLKYKLLSFSGKRFKNEKLSMNAFESINKKEDNELINGFIYKSILTGQEIIMIKLNFEYNKQNIKIFEQIKKEIEKQLNIIKEKDISYNKLNSYIQINDKIISYEQLDELLLKELIDKKIIIQTEQIKIEKENNKTQIYTPLNDDKNNNSNELEREKNKNIKNQIEIENQKKIKLNNDTKESLIEKILEKDKEIKELKVELSRFPFILNDGETLLSIIFISTDQKIHYSLICKNTDKFEKIEKQLYEKYPDYSKSENYFTLRGNIINKSENLEFNQIMNSDIITLNIKE